MPFDETDFRSAAANKSAPTEEARRDLRMFQQAGINADHVTSDPAWDQFLTYIQAQIEASEKRRAAFIAELASPQLTNADQITVKRNEVFRLDEQIRVLNWVIAMPAQIKSSGLCCETAPGRCRNGGCMSQKGLPETRLVVVDGPLPPIIMQRLRKIVLDRFTGNVQLNIKDGRVLGFHVVEVIMLPASQI
jgi:hypothetical protein